MVVVEAAKKGEVERRVQERVGVAGQFGRGSEVVQLTEAQEKSKCV